MCSCNCNYLQDKIVIITGAGGGIGSAMTNLFLNSGAIIYAVERREGSLDNIVHPNLIPVYMDITSSEQIRSLFMKIKKESGRLDVLVNNAGVMLDAVIGMITKEQIETTYAINVFAVIDMIQYGVKFFRKQRSGSIINLASIMGTHGDVNKMLYSSSKGAIVAMTKSAAKELAPYGIRVNAISPGSVDTPLLSGLSVEIMEQTIKTIKIGKLAQPDDIAQLALFLASDNSSYITGQIIGVDGCMII